MDNNMKRISYILMAIAALVLASCNANEFLERNSLTSMDDGSYWTTEGNVRLFVNGAYGSYFCGYSDNWGSVYAPACYSYEMSDERTTTGTQANILVSLPSDNWYRAELGYRGYWLQRRGAGPWKKRATPFQWLYCSSVRRPSDRTRRSWNRSRCRKRPWSHTRSPPRSTARSHRHP